MQKRFALFIALIALVAVSVFTGLTAAADGNQCGSSTINSGASVVQNAGWRMEVGVDEAAYTGPSIRDRLHNNWNDEAKRSYRWTSASMPVDAGMSTELMAVSAAVIGEGLPLLERGHCRRGRCS